MNGETSQGKEQQLAMRDLAVLKIGAGNNDNWLRTWGN
jgi:hypothetical protein